MTDTIFLTFRAYFIAVMTVGMMACMTESVSDSETAVHHGSIQRLGSLLQSGLALAWR